MVEQEKQTDKLMEMNLSREEGFIKDLEEVRPNPRAAFDPYHLKESIIHPKNFDSAQPTGIFPLSAMLHGKYLDPSVKELAKFVKIFEGEYYITANQAGCTFSSSPFHKLLGFAQKPFSYLMIKEEENKNLQFFFIDQEEAKILFKSAATSDKIWLYSPYSRNYSIICGNAQPDEWHKSNNPSFFKSLVKCLLFTGFYFLSEPEQQALQELIESMGVLEFQKLLYLTRGNALSKIEQEFYGNLFNKIPQQNTSLSQINPLKRKRK